MNRNFDNAILSSMMNGGGPNDGLRMDPLIYHHLYINNERRSNGSRSESDFYIPVPDFGPINMTQFLIKGVWMDNSIYNVSGSAEQIFYVSLMNRSDDTKYSDYIFQLYSGDGFYNIYDIIDDFNKVAGDVTAE